MYLTSIITPSYSILLKKVNTGIGNCLFQISSVICLAIKNKRLAIFPNLKLLCEKIMNLTGDNYKDTIYRNINMDGNINDFIIIEEHDDIINIIKNNNINLCINGYLETYTYFDNYRELLLDIFSIDTNSLNYIKNKYPSLFDTNIIHISIHIRMNDLESFDCGFEYYKKAIEYMNSKFDNIHYYVLSDNIGYYLDLIKGLNINFTYIENNPDYIDLWIQTLCHHNIICMSTFSWWGAYLNNNKDKIVLYPLSSIEKKVRRSTHYHTSFTGL